MTTVASHQRPTISAYLVRVVLSAADDRSFNFILATKGKFSMVLMAHTVLALIALAVVRSLVLRRNLITPIGERPYRGGWKIVAFIIILYVLQATLVVYAPGQTVFQMLIMTSTHLGFAIPFFLNRHIPGAKLVALGLILNVTVTIANGGWMPITPEAAHFVYRDKVPIEIGIRLPRSKSIVLDKEDTNLWILSDIIRIKVPWRRAALSIGDVLLVAGIAQSIFQVTSKEDGQDFHRKKWGQEVALARVAGDT